MPSQRRIRNWFFTCHDTDWSPKEIPTEKVKYAVWQLERGEKTQKDHLQGYIEFHAQMTMTAMKKIHSTANWQERKGTQQQVIDYCTKEETRVDGPWTIGELKKQGQRTDLEQVAEALNDGATPREIIADYGAVALKYQNNINRIYQILSLDREYNHHECRGIWIYAPSGNGKTTYARSAYPGAYKKSAYNKWFDGYTDQQYIIMDDFDFRSAKNDDIAYILKECAHEFSFAAEVKGGTVQLRHTAFVVTAQFDIDTYYFSEPSLCDAIKRRFKQVALPHWDESFFLDQLFA